MEKVENRAIIRVVVFVCHPSKHIIFVTQALKLATYAYKHFASSLGTSGISSVDYDISSFTEQHLLTILGDMEKLAQPRFNMLLFCSITTTVSVLRQLGNSTKSRMWTLMFHPEGPAFMDVALFNDTIRNATDVFPNMKLGYNGRQFTAVMKENNYGFGEIAVNKRKLFGFSFSVLNMLAEAMNFSFRIIPPREDEWGKDVNGSWTGLFGMLQRREADLASDILTIHTDRTSVADYILPPICETKQVIIYKKEDEEDHFLILLRPFQTHVFVTCGVSLMTCIIFLSAIRITHEFNNNKCPTGAWTVETASVTASELLGATLKQGSTIPSLHYSERILVAGWWMFTTVISAVYCGTIMAIFAVKKENPPFSNMAELAARQDYKIGYDISSITENLLQNSRHPDVVAVKQRVQELSITDPSVFSSNDTEHLQRVWNGKYAYISGMLLTALSKAKCKLKVIDTEFGNAFIAFYLPKSSPYKKDFEKSMSYLSDSGILQRSYEEWFPPATDDGCPVEDFPRAMSLVKIHSIFLAGGGGVVCSFMVLAAEILWYKIKQKHR
ncbi:glutamate receptor ionotropic, kainate 5-like [Haliotis asinina]|uniref:glutamate receptor ionotropic, kainate 5-like n=1 Tax=Haliotis asinina TaxID=109174 RepID=UPI003531D17F